MSSPLQFQNPPSPTATLESVTMPDGNLAEVVVPRGGALSPSAPAVVSVDNVTSTPVVAANTNRKGLVLVNLSSNSISIAFGTAALFGQGITLIGPGGTFEMDSYTFSTAAVNALAGGAASALSVQEFS